MADVDPQPAVRPAAGGAGAVVRRIIVFVILYALVTIAATGLSGLLERVLGAGRVLVAADAGLALSLAFTLIGAPLAAVLWWWQRRRLALDSGERASLVWALYLAAMSLTALIVAATSLVSAANWGIEGQWRPGALSAGIVWTLVWLWHRHMRRSSKTAPTRLADLPVELGALYGLIVSASGAIGALAALFSEALASVAPVLLPSHWLTTVLQSLVWCAAGALVWWWHWFRERAKSAPGTFAAVLLVIVVGAAAGTALFSLGTVLYLVLRTLFAPVPLAEALAPLDIALASALVGALVWVYHRRVLATRSARTQRAAGLVVSAIALIGAASGFGVIVNALLASLSPTLLDQDPRTLLLGGISALVVGGPAWWLAWRPDRVAGADAGDPARRVYLVAVFGASAIVGLITLLIIGYRLFEFALDAGGSGGLVERIRAPLGLLSATAIVFGYHFAVWRRDRAAMPKPARRAIGRVILVAAGDASDEAAGIRAATGAAVTVWSAAEPGARLGEADMLELLASLRELSAPRVLVVVRPDGRVSVTPLAD